VSQHADCCLPCGQFNGEPRLVGIGQPEVLVVKRPGRRAAEDTDPEDCQDPDGIAIGDPGVLQRDRRVVGGELIWEDGEYELPSAIGASLLLRLRAPACWNKRCKHPSRRTSSRLDD
jgi:hypothetical protein